MSNCHLFQCIGQCNSSRQDKRSAQLAASAFQSMSSEEQDEVYSDLHGFDEGPSIDETAEFIRTKLQALRKEIDKVDVRIMRHYLHAIKKEQDLGGEQYVTSDKFLLMFLRADKFDCSQAARRLTAYFQEKFELFGDEKLACRIKASDLNEEDKKTFLRGGYYMTGETDMAGRAILFARRQIVLQLNVPSSKRVLFYMIQNVLENNETTQKKGLIFIGYNLNQNLTGSAAQVRGFLPVLRMMLHAMPIRFAGCHICYDDLRDLLFSNLSLVVLPRYLRARFQGHFQSTVQECLMNLAPYGIDPSTLPIKADGELRHELLHAYLKREQQLEEQATRVAEYFEGPYSSSTKQ